MEKCLTGCDEKKGNVYTVSTHVAGQKSQWGVRPSKVRFQTKSFSLSLSLLSLKRTRARARKNTHMLIFIRLYQHCRFFMYISLLFFSLSHVSQMIEYGQVHFLSSVTFLFPRLAQSISRYTEINAMTLHRNFTNSFACSLSFTFAL